MTELHHRYDYLHNYWMPEPNVSVSFMPLSHSDRVVQTITIINGGKVAFYSGSMDTLMDDIRIARPTALTAPPRFWNMIYSEVSEE